MNRACLTLLVLALASGCEVRNTQTQPPPPGKDGADGAGTGDAGDATSPAGDGDGAQKTETATEGVQETWNFGDVSAPEGSVKALQILAETTGCDPNQIVNYPGVATLTSVVVSAPRFVAVEDKATGTVKLYGYFVADQDGGLWSGIGVTVDAASPAEFQVGDVLTIIGDLKDFYCDTEIDAGNLEKTGLAPEPLPVELLPAAAQSEPYEGMLVTVKGVEVTATGAGGTFVVSGGLRIGHAFDFFLSLEVGATYDLTGIIKYDFGAYVLMPRSQKDVVLLTAGPGVPATIKDIQASSESVDCAVDGAKTYATGLNLTGIVTTPRWDASSKLHGYYLSDGTQDLQSGILLVVLKDLGTDYALGTQLEIQGKHVEYYCNTQIEATTLKETGTGAVPDPLVVEDATLVAAAEPYEGMLVELHDVQVTSVSDWDSFGYAKLDSGLLIDRSIIGKTDFPKPVEGQTWAVVRGIVRYAFAEWRIAPRTLEDLVKTPAL
jgi:predicted extracellular nuclease